MVPELVLSPTVGGSSMSGKTPAGIWELTLFYQPPLGKDRLALPWSRVDVKDQMRSSQMDCPRSDASDRASFILPNVAWFFDVPQRSDFFGFQRSCNAGCAIPHLGLPAMRSGNTNSLGVSVPLEPGPVKGPPACGEQGSDRIRGNRCLVAMSDRFRARLCQFRALARTSNGVETLLRTPEGESTGLHISRALESQYDTPCRIPPRFGASGCRLNSSKLWTAFSENCSRARRG